MKQLYHIFKKELYAYFLSPIAYIVIAIFLIVTGWFFFSTFFLFNQASLRNFFALMPIMFAFVVPAVTMRLFAEEFNIGSHEMLLTMPVSVRQVVLGKYLASTFFMVITLLPTLSYPLTISLLGQLDWGPVLGGYIGTFLLAGAFSAVGLFASSLTKNQIIAFITAMSICFCLTMLDKMLFFIPSALLGFLGYLGADSHFANFAKGIIDTRDILYFASVAFIGLYATHMSIEDLN